MATRIERFREYIPLGGPAPGTERLPEMGPAMGDGEGEGSGLTVDAENRAQTIRDEFGKAMATRLQRAIADGIGTLPDAFADIRTLFRGMLAAIDAVTGAGAVGPDPNAEDDQPVPSESMESLRRTPRKAPAEFLKQFRGSSAPLPSLPASTGFGDGNLVESDPLLSRSTPAEKSEFARLFR